MAAIGVQRAEPESEGSWPLRITSIVCIAAIVWGYAQSEDSDLVADAGLGYALGIIGLGQMVVMLAYSLRKRMSWLAGKGRIQRWFEIHMMLGLLGPTAILLHCNFELGSLNSSVALISMLLVSGSGIAGRFLYVRIHRTLLGERITIESQMAELRGERGALTAACEGVFGLEEELDELQSAALGSNESVFARVVHVGTLPFRGWALRRRAFRNFKLLLVKAEQRPARAALSSYVKGLGRVSTLRVYEWLFGLWHAVHLPLSFILFGSAAVHVVAVHMY